MQEVINIINKLYRGDLSAVYGKARCLSGDGIDLQASPIDVSDCVSATITSIDWISDRLAYVLTDGEAKTGYFREVFGLLKTGKKWLIVSMLKSLSRYRFDNMYDSFETPQEDLNTIYSILNRYCHDVYLMDAPDCLKLFWDDCRMYHPNEDGGFTDVEIQVLYDRWKDMPDPQKLGIQEFSRIYHVELLDANTAVAKLGCAKLNNYFMDYHFLLKVNGEWKMANKMTQELYTGELI
ncbi:MAG: nuclear transport factor 2 family protein [Lachnospiraceae bacterium]|nr:nuclear transport factor 2 family protein [Lachnospiraceae bacterium]